MSDPLVSFICVTYKTPHHVRHFYEGLQKAKPGFSYECLLIDNGADGTVEMVREKFPWVKVTALAQNKGLAVANNIALKQAQGEYIFLLNTDLVIFPGELDRWLGWLRLNPDVGLCGPRLVNPDGTDQESCYRFPSPLIPVYRRTFLGAFPWAKRILNHFLMRDLDRGQAQPVDWIMGAAMLARRDFLQSLGGMDERFFLYLEDTDLCRRVWKAGKRVMYTPVAKLIHFHGRESGTRHPWEILFNRATRLHVKSALQYFWKYRKEEHPRINQSNQ